MVISTQDAEKARTLFEKAQRIVCLCHRNPDGDAVGSLLGMGMLLERACVGKPVSFHCVDAVPDVFHFLPDAKRIQGPPVLQVGDVVVFLDCAEPRQTGLHEAQPQLFDKTHLTINIDHHPTNTQFADLNFVVPDAASSCEIVVALADLLEWEMDSTVATCLLTGVYTDTGGLLHSNTTAGVYRTVARLLRAGARQQAIVCAVFRTARLSTLKLWGRVLEKIALTEEGGAISALTQGDFRATGAEYSELTGAIDYVNAVPGMRFSLILSERDGIVKGSLRTLRDDVDVAKMASKFNGGGHRKAAGFSVPGVLQPEVHWKVVQPSTDPASPPVNPPPSASSSS